MKAINLLPGKQAVYALRVQHAKCFFIRSLLATLGAGLLLYVINALWIYHLEDRLHDLHRVEAEQVAPFAAVKTVMDNIQHYQDTSLHLQQAQDETQRLVNFLMQMPQMIKHNLYLVHLNWYDHTGILYGQATDTIAVNDFLSALTSNGFFKDIALIKSDYRHEEDGTPPLYFMIHFSS